jgi:DNA-binding MarR family transcriptional regulator
MSNDNRDTIISELALAVRAYQNAVDAIDQIASEVMGINRTDLRCLDLLAFRERMTAGQLAEAAGLSTCAVTAVLDRLERAGYVQRVRDTEDRRRIFIAVTDEARRRSEEIYGAIGAEGLAALEKYSTKELALLRDFMLEGTELNMRQAARLREGLKSNRDYPR